MRDFADRDDIDTLAASLFTQDHPERMWISIERGSGRLGSAPAHVRAMYRGFARVKLMEWASAEAAVLPAAFAAAVADGSGPSTMVSNRKV